MCADDRETLEAICSQIKTLQKEGGEKELKIFIKYTLKAAINLKCSDSLINEILTLKHYIDSGIEL